MNIAHIFLFYLAKTELHEL